MRHLLAAMVLSVIACSATDPPTRCTPGAQVTCPCPGGGSGAQVCAASGDGYGACSCGTADAGADAAAIGDAPAADAPPVGDGGAPVDAVAVGDVVSPRDVPAVDTGTPSDSSAPGDAGPASCYTEEGTDPLCPRQRYMNNEMTPSWRVTALTITQPVALASPLIAGVINPPLRDGRFLWGVSVDFANNTFRTGPLNRMFTRGTVGLGLMDGTFAYYNNNAPTMGGMPNRWNPATGMTMGTSTVSTVDSMATVNLPIFNDDGSILVELPLSNARLVDVPVSMDRGCIGLGRIRAGRYNECTSEWETMMGGTVEAAITVEAARNINVSALNQTLCQLLSGTPCTMPQMSWMRQPDTMVGGQPAYRLVAKFAAVSANIQ